MFGPVVRWELVRLARRGHVTRVRVLLLYTLLLAIVVFAMYWSVRVGDASSMRVFRGVVEPLPVAQATDFARSLTLALLEAQLLLVAIVTPVYAAASVAQEKDQQTLTLLLTTQLTDRELVCGKAVAQMATVLAAVAAGIPVLMVPWFFGAVEIQLLAAGYGLILGTIVLGAAIGVSAGCHAPDTRSALVRALGLSLVLIGGLLLPPFVFLTPFALVLYVGLNLTSPALQTALGFGYPLAQVVVAWAVLREASRSLRNLEPTAGAPEPTAYPEPPRGRPIPIVFGAVVSQPRSLPPVSETDPVLWKERQTGLAPVLPALARPARVLGVLIAVAAATLFVLGSWQLVKRTAQALDPDQAGGMIRSGSEPADGASVMLTTAGVFAATLYLVPLAIGITGCVVRERQRGTLEPLLGTTLSRTAILKAKTLAHAERGLIFAAGAVAGLGAGFGAANGAIVGIAAAAAFAAGVLLVIGLGQWLSVRCGTPTQAFRFCFPAVVLTVGLPVAAAQITSWKDAPSVGEVFTWAAAGGAILGGFFWWRAAASLAHSVR